VNLPDTVRFPSGLVSPAGGNASVRYVAPPLHGRRWVALAYTAWFLQLIMGE
jgi:hypothetical protein